MTPNIRKITSSQFCDWLTPIVNGGIFASREKLVALLTECQHCILQPYTPVEGLPGMRYVCLIWLLNTKGCSFGLLMMHVRNARSVNYGKSGVTEGVYLSCRRDLILMPFERNFPKIQVDEKTGDSN